MLHAPGFWLRAAEQRRAALWRDTVGQGLTTAAVALLCAIALWPGEDQQYLGEQVGIDKASVTELVKRLGASAVIRKTLDPMDGRRRRLWLTQDGAVALSAVAKRAEEVEERLLGPVGACERAVVLDLWRRVGKVVLTTSDLRLSPCADTDVGEIALSFLTQAGFFLRRVRQEHARLWDALVPALTPGQYATLDVLYYKPDQDVRTTARSACLEETTGARLLSRLERRGLLAKSPDPTDLRRLRLDLTTEGRRALRDATPGVNEVQALLMSPLRQYERGVFNDLTSRVALLV